MAQVVSSRHWQGFFRQPTKALDGLGKGESDAAVEQRLDHVPAARSCHSKVMVGGLDRTRSHADDLRTISPCNEEQSKACSRTQVSHVSRYPRGLRVDKPEAAALHPTCTKEVHEERSTQV